MKRRLNPIHLMLLAALLAGLVLSAAACAQEPFVPPTPIPTLVPATLPPATPTEAAPSGGETPAAAEPPASAGDLVEVGQGVFEQNCAVCHNLTDETLVGPGLAGLFDLDQLPNGQPVNDENLAEWITNGGGAMPAVPLPNDELEALIAFLHDATE